MLPRGTRPSSRWRCCCSNPSRRSRSHRSQARSPRAAALHARTAAALPGAPTLRGAWVARIVIPTPARSAPGAGPVRTVSPTSAVGNGGPVVLLVLGSRAGSRGHHLAPGSAPTTPEWRVGLDRLRPRRAHADAVADRRLGVRARTVSLLRGGRVLDSWRAVVGKPSTPTPRGLYAIYERVRQPRPNDFRGTWALLLTAFSPVLHNFDGGPGQVAIHGRGGASLLDPLGARARTAAFGSTTAPPTYSPSTAPEGTPVQIH